MIYLSRRDPAELLGTFSSHPILLDELSWPTAEHYFQANQFTLVQRQELIRAAPTALAAEKLGQPAWFRRWRLPLRKDWHTVRRVFMTRALYTKCKTYPVVAEQLLQTGDEPLIENSQYDYYWGCGRDQRGANTYGLVLMDIRQKLRAEGN